MTESLIIGAFLGGLISFLAPCVLPIIPGFLAYLAGASTTETSSKRKEIFMNSVFFVFGFGVVFALLGVLLNTLLENIAYDVQLWLSRLGGVMIIFFGLYLVGLIKIPFLEKEYKFGVKTKFKSRYVTSFLFGLAFAAGWTPCVGPALGVILGLAATAPGSAFILLLTYALGLGIPFLIVGSFTGHAAEFINRHAVGLNYLNIVFGIILLILGILIFTQKLSLIANFEFLNRLLLT
ncbi:MAG: cytochrome c bioproteinis protein [Parcubacteria group bacterium Gr01-1014_48]|nr:MAG: cytochrome c bioproteinis protein [Parcubacteria group bacterium Greene0416_14]TSC73942.1 MAG: cytochrome c bioproteinis protein [Parcubacteria group bacterium Gr01-1014_48]TSD00941.1 MAG: cytochrome c bioproteinis protein [Parcubacteria group bacterium Greene1014_15]TSD07893.1 MAG: cytochrome c bioproteinis protein [Parcubacteria group bacterium Greene0714_4]